ncbi:stealth conserved region 3 domain-containing protein [Microbacterium sp. NE2HP2]|uniref:stealth conserved region 3 domain-containing protein n=1 Tax=Microbacterium TaxID=33882 RepID=UPI00236504DD|nr:MULTISPECIES: stealth conserved region 3 domain-containing protein [Microbacterium]MDD7945993.1 stealth conserved region 3 domain-containing protein [Microbacterium plantarum]WHE34935.1 stealth conserved region 3 domain-containing protein [Microbacterium sp. BDGP8]
MILDEGVLRLVHETTTPDGARTADLLLIADALESAGIRTLLIRHDLHTPALAIDLADAHRTAATLRSLGQREPLYLKAKGTAPVFAADADIPDSAPHALRAYRPRVSAGGGRRYDHEYGVRVEFWRFGETAVEAPQANALMRRITPAQDVHIVSGSRYGREWQTVVGMLDPHPREVTHDIDMVFSWVDGSASEFQRQRAAQLSEYVVGEGDDGPARYRHVDELRYALRSVHMYAPWVRRIFIATDSPAPAWLADHPKVTIVRSEEFFADPSTLPTHNSHAVEAQLHRIDGLAEHFLYSNDDMFFGRPVRPELFFSPGGISSFVECDVRIGAGDPRLERSGHDNGLRVNRALLQERFGRVIVRDLEHCAAPLRRSVMQELEETFPEDFRRTAASRFRAATDISVTNSLYHYYAMFTGRALPTSVPRTRYVQTTLARSLAGMERLAKRRDIDMFCLNDGGETEVPEEIRVASLRDVLERMFPIRAPWEIPAVSEGRARDASAARSGVKR